MNPCVGMLRNGACHGEHDPDGLMCDGSPVIARLEAVLQSQEVVDQGDDPERVRLLQLLGVALDAPRAASASRSHACCVGRPRVSLKPPLGGLGARIRNYRTVSGNPRYQRITL